MSGHLKVINGTPTSGKSRCDSCVHCQTVKGQNCEEIKTCEQGMFGAALGLDRWGVRRLPGRIIFKVSDCTGYRESTQISLGDMEKIAWTISARKRGSVGFAEGQTNPDELEMVISPPERKEHGVQPADSSR